ncbi:uncharacterized protein LOC134341818 [Mobula hypostoma]|uniref:uncharacterized protein LOC134341818 n=1 Tax=Mobula hypostoma TaxID=723540 RepID=UPI002FC2C431
MTEDEGTAASEPARGLTAPTGENPSDSEFPSIQSGESLTCSERFIRRKAHNWKQTTTIDEGTTTSEPARGLRAPTGENPSDSEFPLIHSGESLTVPGIWSKIPLPTLTRVIQTKEQTAGGTQWVGQHLWREMDRQHFGPRPSLWTESGREIVREKRLSPAGGAFFHPDSTQADDYQPTSVRVRMDTDLNSAISAFLSNCEDHQLFRLTRFYMERLEQAIEEGVEGVGFMLMGEDHFTGPEYHVSGRNID